MNLPSTDKTEDRTLNALEGIIDEHLNMSYKFNSCDKEMSWDGFIWLFQPGCNDHSKHNAIARIPVQIKGHNDATKKYINKKSITYPVEVEDLRLYGTEKGVVYFQIFIDQQNVSLFYISLFPSKIADYLDTGRNKRERTRKNIPFVRLDKDPVKLYNILLRFNNESLKQGTAHTPLVKNRIKLSDLPKIKEINLSAPGASNPYEAFMSFVSGDVCLYGKLEGDQYERPIQWDDKAEFVYGKIVSQQMRVGDTVYYEKYRAEADKTGNIKITPSPNILIDLDEHRITYKPISTIPELYHDACFLKALFTEKALYVGETCVCHAKFDHDHTFEKKLDFIIDLYEPLSLIDLSIENPFVNYDRMKMDQLIDLLNLRHRKPQAKNGVEYHSISWKYGDKYYPLILKDDGDSTELFSSIYSKTLGLFVEDEEDCGEKIMYRVPLVIAEKPEVLANLYEYRYDVFLEQINDAEINRITYDQILSKSLVLICTYDINGDEQFLSLAEKLLNRLNAFKPYDYTTLNLLQIKKRRTGLDKDDETILESINSDDVYARFGKYVLLNDKASAEACFAEFPMEEQEKYQQYPIYTLYSRLS